MTEARPTDLIYGHLGDPHYDTETQQWHFPRQLSGARPIVPLGSANVVQSACLLNRVTLRQNVAERLQQAKAIFRQNPDLPHDLDLLTSHAQVSEAITDAATNFEPTASELLAFGTAIVLTRLRDRAKVPIAAVAAGSAGELVQILLLRKEQLGWDGNKVCGIHHYTANGTEQVWWRGNGSPIQQICVAANIKGEGGSSIAVRYHGAVSILKPFLRSRIVSQNQSATQDFLLPASRLDPHEVLKINTQDTGGVPFADVSFNPWDHEQLAIINQKGSWNVWDLEANGGDEEVRHLRRVCTGCWDRVDTSESSQLICDGWARILWVYDFRTLLVASRRSLNLMMINTSPREIRMPDLSLTSSLDYLIDMKRSPANPAHVYLVTSTRLFWLSVTVTRDEEELTDPEACVTVLLCWVHYRSLNDMSLHLGTLVEQEDYEDEDNSMTLNTPEA